MTNLDKLQQAGLFHTDTQNQGSLSNEALQVINNLTVEEVDGLISAFNQVGQSRKGQLQGLMSVCGF
jgi:hypothetical protein